VKIFRVKDIPPPFLKLGGKLATSTLEFTRNEVRQLGGVGAEAVGFMFPVNFVVKSFDLTIQGAGDIPCQGNSLTPAAKTALSNMRVGQIAYIDNIKVKKPNGDIVSMPLAKIKIKS
jgi:hypothetical protein